MFPLLILCCRHQFLTFLDSFVDCSDVQERLFGKIIDLAVENHIETANAFLDGDHYSRYARKLFGYGEGLAQEALNASCAVHRLPVFVGEFVHSEDGNDVLQLFVFLQNLLYALCAVVMFFPDDGCIQDTRRRIERVDCRVNSQLSNLTAQDGCGVQVGERSGGSGVGQVVSRDVNSLNRRNRSIFRRRDAFLHGTHFAGKRRLVSHGRRHTSQQRGNL